MKGPFKSALIGPDGMLRPIWRAAIFYAVGTGLIFPVLDRLFNFVAGSLHLRPGFTAANVGFGELLLNFSDALICTGAFALYERRRIDSYGLPIQRALGWQTFEGALGGVIMAGAVALGVIVLGGMRVEGFNGRGTELILSALEWMGANICVGLAEEFWFRSYFQQTLWKSIGFWPASIVIALIFAAEHYSSRQVRTFGT
jgi:membrane protease YdiL (CAAX protease family)